MNTPKMIVRDLRVELALVKPDYQASQRMIADALELLDARIDNIEKAPQAVEVRHGAEPEVRGRKKR